MSKNTIAKGVLAGDRVLDAANEVLRVPEPGQGIVLRELDDRLVGAGVVDRDRGEVGVALEDLEVARVEDALGERVHDLEHADAAGRAPGAGPPPPSACGTRRRVSMREREARILGDVGNQQGLVVGATQPAMPSSGPRRRCSNCGCASPRTSVNTRSPVVRPRSSSDQWSVAAAVESVEQLAQDDSRSSEEFEEAGGPKKDAKIWPGRFATTGLVARSYAHGCNRSRRRERAMALRVQIPVQRVDPAFAEPA
jgi:hypothetical protein